MAGDDNHDGDHRETSNTSPPVMKVEHYLSHTDYPIWQVIQNGNGLVSVTTDTNEMIKFLPPKTAKEMDLKWKVAMISIRIKKFHKNKGRKLQFNTKDPVGFDMTKVECFNCHKMGHFTRDCRAKGNHNSRRRNVRYNGYKTRENGRRLAYQDDSKALVTINEEDIDWSGHVEEDAQNYAIMAYSSSNSSSDNKEYESDSDNESVSNVLEDKEKPSFAFTDSVKHVKTSRENVKEIGTPNHSPKLRSRIEMVTLEKKGKQHKASCKAKTVSSVNQPLQILHMDLFGPTSDETTPILKDFIRQVKNQFNHKVKTIRSDNGIEFKNNELVKFCGLKGIKREYSNAITPQQNRVAERKNKTLIEASRTMLADLFLPTTFWAEVVNTACYVPNRVLVTKPQNKTPYELLTGTQAKDDQGANSEEIDLHEENFVLPIWSAYSTTVKNSGDKIEKNTNFKTCEKPVCQVEQIILEELETFKRQEKEANDVTESLRKEATHDIQNANTSSTNLLNSVSTPLNTAGPSRAFNDGELLYLDDPLMPHLEDIYASPSDGIFTDSSYDDEGMVTDFNNLKTTVNVSLTPTTRIHTIHPKTQILRDPMSAVQTRSKVNKNSEARALEGIDYDEVFAPVARIEAIRIFLAFASYIGFIVYQMDVKSAFLYGIIDEKVYVAQPPGFVDPKFPNKVYKVVKALYGLHQAPRAWSSRKKMTASTPIETQKPLVNEEEAIDVDSVLVLGFRLLQRLHTFKLRRESLDSDYAGVNLDRKSITGASPTIRTSCIKQYWTTAKVKTINDEVRIQALIDEKRVNIKESSIHHTLKLDDVEGTSCLANAKIFNGLAMMGYEKLSEKLTFYKAFFSPQWKFLIHNILQFVQLLINHQLGDMSHHKDIYDTPSVIKKVFNNIKRVGAGFSRVLTALFDNMLVPATEEVVLELESEVIDTKSSSKERIEKLEGRVAKLKEENTVLKELDNVHSKGYTAAPIVDKEKSFKQGRIIAEIDEDIKINLEEAQAKLYKIDLEHPQKVLITTARATTTTKAPKVSVPRRKRGVILQEPEETTSTVVMHSKVQSKDKGKEATPLASKVPIIDYNIHFETNKPYFKIIRADEPKNYSDDYLLKTLKIMFKQPDVEASVWKDQKGRYRLAKMDVKSDFLYEKIKEEVYVCQPLGFEDPDFPDKVYKVEKALYRLHQALRGWYETLSTYLLDNGFHREKIDKTLFIRRHKDDILLIQVYVDDIIFGLQVKQKQAEIFISQDKYVAEILKKYGFSKVKNASTSMETQKPLLKDEDGKEVDVHIYLKGQPKFGLWYLKDSPFDLIAYTDSDYAGASLDRSLQQEAKTVNREGQLQALVDGKKILITESTIRRDLQLEDNEGVDYLPNDVIFEQLILIGKPRRKVTVVPQPSNPISLTEETVNEEMDVSLERAATTATSLAAKQDRGVNIPQSGEDSLKLIELMELCTKLQQRVLDLETTKTTQDLEIDNLKRRVKRIKRRKRSRTYILKEYTSFLAQALVELKHVKPKAKAKGIVFHEPKESTTIITAAIPKLKSQDKEQEISKKQKIDDDKEIADLQQLFKIISNEERVAIDAIPLDVKPPSIKDVVDRRIKSLYEVTAVKIRVNVAKLNLVLLSNLNGKYAKYDLVKLSGGLPSWRFAIMAVCLHGSLSSWWFAFMVVCLGMAVCLGIAVWLTAVWLTAVWLTAV
uniref:Uncharacterized protein n=1 Tax=Tanacetum cinerariifolium TaxID=118510 RepID=A0A6L2LD42_TANCI|nr:hypothetical protein [Tanacetum cinerariifolium]